jgi:hypothetical protein
MQNSQLLRILNKIRLKVINNFFDQENRLKVIPAQRKRK